MSYKLVIAEKPSVAQSIAKVIGADKREDGYLEGNGYLVSWCVGHLVELAPPEAYDEKYEKWRYSDLPILPSEWKYQISDATRKQFGILKKLMEREDVTGLVEATDAGREGELIFRLVYHQAKCKKPFERLWISSMEDQAISDGFSNLQNGKKYDDLYRAALCRERADWSVGMNATRLFSTLYGQTLNVGRVMTPTLAMIVQREAEIESFKPEPIYRLSISCGGITAVSDRFEKKEDAEKKENSENKDEAKNKEPEKTTIFYVTDPVQQSQYINMFREAGKNAVILSHNIDTTFISHLEQKDQTIQFKRIDADVTEELKGEGAADENTAKTLTELFRKNLNMEKLEVKAENLKNESVAAMMTLSEESRRMQDMMKMYNMYGMDPGMFGGQETLVLNVSHPLVKYLAENQESEHAAVICQQLYDLAMLSHKQLSPDEMTKFVQRSNEILMLLTK